MIITDSALSPIVIWVIHLESAMNGLKSGVGPINIAESPSLRKHRAHSWAGSYPP